MSTTVHDRPATHAEAVALRSFAIMVDGTLEDFEEVIHPECVNREAKDEPPDARQAHGPAALYATALWLREAFAELRFDIHEVVQERDLVVVHNTMSGRHVQPFAEFDADGRVGEVFPPTGKRFASTQSHWIRIRDGKVVEHWANRDDIGTAKQLGWVPPSPVYLMKMWAAKRRARRVYGG